MSLSCRIELVTGMVIKLVNPLRTIDGYSHSLRDATVPVDLYSRIPTSMQVMRIAA